MKKLVTLAAATLLAVSPLAFADNASNDMQQPAAQQQDTNNAKQMADATSTAPAADASNAAAASTQDTAKAVKKHAKKHKKHHRAKKADSATPATPAAPASTDAAPAQN